MKTVQRLILFLFIMYSVGLFSQPNQKEIKPNQSLIPENDLGIIVNEFISEINSSDQKRILDFVQKYLSNELTGIGSEKWTKERYSVMLQNLSNDGGILTPVDVRENGSSDYLALIFKTSKSGKIAGIEFIKNKDSNTLRLLEVHAMQMHSVPYQWPNERLDYTGIAMAVDEKVQKDVDAELFSGVVLVAKGDEILLHNPYSYASKEEKILNTIETRFHTGSIGKMITATAVVQLVEKGLLKFTDKIGEILNDYPNQDAAEKVTMHDLLTHTSGIADPFELGRRKPGVDYSTAESNLPLFANAELKMEPGSFHSYSNGNYTVLALVVEKISGISLEQYLRDNIFIPAGMDISSPEFYRNLPMAVRYSHTPEEDPLAIYSTSPVKDNNNIQFEYSGYCNGYLTAGDVYKFLKALREGKLISAEMAEVITSGKVNVEQGAPAKYAYGFYDANMWGVNMRGHSGGGSSSGIGADAEMLWDNEYYVIVLGNCDLEKVRPIALSICRFLGNQD